MARDRTDGTPGETLGQPAGSASQGLASENVFDEVLSSAPFSVRRRTKSKPVAREPRFEAPPPPASAPPEPAAGGKPVEVADPLASAEGRSLRLRSMLGFRWPSDTSYLSESAAAILRDVISRFAADGSPTYEMKADELVEALLAGGPLLESSFIGQLQRWAQQILPENRPPAPPTRPLAAERLILADGVVLRWDVVDILAEASALRRRTNRSDEQIGTRHLGVALVRSRAGQAALAAAGLLDGGLEPLALHFRSLLQEIDFSHLGDSREAWHQVAAELAEQPLLVSTEIETRVSYAADRAERVAVDSIGVREDARALSDLILLDAAKPPMAIGLFGAWGSGKSTLIKELQHRIQQDLKQESLLVAAGLQDANPDTRRVRNVVQIEFNAWAFADSANLWASLTAEIFDQLSAGGIRPDDASRSGERTYAALVSEVKLRNSRAANALRTAAGEIADLEGRMDVAQKKIEQADCDRKLAPAEAVLSAAGRYLLRTEAAPGGGAPASSWTERMRSALEKTGRPGELVTAYAGAGAASRWLMMIRDFAVAQRARWPLVLLVGGCAAIAFYLAAPAAAFLRNAIGLLGAAGVLGALAGVLPAIRAALLFGQQIRDRRREAAARAAEARAEAVALEAKLALARATHRREAVWAERFHGVGEEPNASSPALMLEYLLSDSADVESLRQQQGVISKVRRCFEQLDAVIARMRSDPAARDAVDRIVLYIDDLDRCSAEQVSNVLQAVHLLLAFECFVVVVAVDARWLKQSLETQHSHLAPATPGGTSEEARATAADYLEKIFQIPLWVRPLVDEDAPEGERYSAYQRFVESVARPAAAPERTVAPPPAPPVPGSDDGAAGAAFVWSTPERPQQLDQPRRRGLQLGDDEVTLLKAIGPLAAKSPRAVKRMINLYRLLRVRYRGADLDAFLGEGAPAVPSYRELLFALACENGLSAKARVELRKCFSDPAAARTGLWSATDLEGRIEARELRVLKAVESAVGKVSRPGLFTAVEEVRRYSFLP